MSEAPPPIDDDEAALAELAAKDLSAVRHVHAQLLAATGADEINSLGRTYQRVSRCLRQTLMLKARHARDRVADAAKAARNAPVVWEKDARERLTDGRIEELQDAIGRIAAVAHPDNLKLQREALDRLDVELEDWVDNEDFLLERLHTLVDEACDRLGLPRAYADTWEDLPRPPNPFDPATAAARPASADPPPVPKA